MSRNIKTVECLKKHEGKTVKVIADNDSVFEATVELDSQGAPVLYTTSAIAAKADYWWYAGSHKGYGHHCANNFQITQELKSLTLLPSRKKKAKKASKTLTSGKEFLTHSEIKKGIGHLCKLSDGQEAFIARSDHGTATICMHSRSNDRGWSLDADAVADKFKDSIKGYSYGWYIHDEDDAEKIQVVSILGKPKAKKASEKEYVSKYLTEKELKEGIGHFCKMSDGSEGFIVWSKVCPRVLLHQQQDGLGWAYNAAREDDDDETAPESFRKQFEYGWNVGNESDAKLIKVVEILDAREKSVEESPKKTLLDMTIREVLEKLDEIISSK